MKEPGITISGLYCAPPRTTGTNLRSSEFLQTNTSHLCNLQHTFLESEVAPGISPGVRQSIIDRRQSFFNHVLSKVKNQKLIK